MRIFQNIKDSSSIQNPVLTLGVFDGVHIGHQHIIQKLNQIAKEIDGESVLLTFEPHPRIVLGKGADDLQLITTLEEKSELLENAGLKNLILHPFTKEFSQLSSVDFVKLLVHEIGIHTIIVGYDHHFGKNREGNFEQLKKLSEEYGFNCLMIEEIKSVDNHISSTQIRKALLNGNIDFANKALDRNYSLSGEVIHGDKLGRTLGFPTANLEIPKYKLIPENGVYIVKVFLKNEIFKGLVSIGTRPTVTNSNERRVEVYILDFDKEIYGEELNIEFFHKIRSDQKFDSLEELVDQMNRDKSEAENYKFTS